jgi:hypothetical protein
LGEPPNDAVSSGQPQPGLGRKLGFVGFSLAAAVLLLVVCDLLVRLTGLDQPQLSAPLMPDIGEEFNNVHRNDDLLFYSLRPNVRAQFGPAMISTNSRGFRSPEFGDKEPGEFRIVSLGESSAFGAGVADDETYAFLLEQHLFRLGGTPEYSVINAGVGAYSSYQSRVFLEERGLALEPDLVLIYHELADFLPTAHRDAYVTDNKGSALSDKQLAESQRHTLSRRLLEVSAIYRLISHSLAQRRASSDGAEKADASADHIVLPKRMREISTPEGMRELKLPVRVPLDEREENLSRMLAFCRAHDIQLVLIHPSYLQSKRHECDLTEFAAREGVPIFEAYDSLHPGNPPARELYWDLWHPNAAGHARVARDLFRYLTENRLVPLAE